MVYMHVLHQATTLCVLVGVKWLMVDAKRKQMNESNQTDSNIRQGPPKNDLLAASSNLLLSVMIQRLKISKIARQYIVQFTETKGWYVVIRKKSLDSFQSLLDLCL